FGVGCMRATPPPRYRSQAFAPASTALSIDGSRTREIVTIGRTRHRERGAARLTVRWPRRALAFSALGGVLLAGWIVTRDVIWPDQHGAKISHFTIDSRYVHKELEVTVIVPNGVRKQPPLLIFLHGRGGDQDSELRNGPMFDELAKLGR